MSAGSRLGLQASLESQQSIESWVTGGQRKPGTFIMSFQYGGRVSEYGYWVITQYNRSMCVTVKVSVGPGGTGHGLSNRTNVPFAPYQLIASQFSGLLKCKN